MTQSKSDRMDISRQDFTRVWGEHNVEAINDIYSTDFRGHGFPLFQTLSREQYRRTVEYFQTMFPDCWIELKDMNADEDFVYASWKFHGTHKNSIAGIPASQARIQFSGSGRHRHRNGKVVEAWLDVEWISILRQIGQEYLPYSE